MRPEHYLPGDIERTSMAIITREMKERGISVPPEQEAVVRRVIHTTADFDYGKNLRFSPDAVAAGAAYLAGGGVIVTDTNMARAGVSKPILARLGEMSAALWRRRRPPARQRSEGPPERWFVWTGQLRNTPTDYWR